MTSLRNHHFPVGLLVALALLAAGCTAATPTLPAAPLPATSTVQAPGAVPTQPPATEAPGGTATPALLPQTGATPAVGTMPTQPTDMTPAVGAVPTMASIPTLATMPATVAALATPAVGVTPAMGATPAAGTVTAGAVNEVTFTAVEYSFQGPQTIPGGWTRITLNNQGKLPHDLNLVKLDPGKTIADVMAVIEQQGPPPEWVMIYGSVSAQPGQSRWFMVDLPPGNYVILSFGEQEGAPPDAAQGMIQQLTVTEATRQVTESQLPTAQATVNMVDYSFVVTGTLRSGDQILEVLNSGTELHQMQLFRLHEGATIQDFMKMAEQGMQGTPEAGAAATPGAGSPTPEGAPGGPPPFDHVGGIDLSPGVRAFTGFDLQPGRYMMVCFIASAAHGGQPHFQLGMIREVAVQ